VRVWLADGEISVSNSADGLKDTTRVGKLLVEIACIAAQGTPGKLTPEQTNQLYQIVGQFNAAVADATRPSS